MSKVINILSLEIWVRYLEGAFLTIRLANKKKWKDQLIRKELLLGRNSRLICSVRSALQEMRRMKLILIRVLTLILVAGIMVYFINIII